MREISRPRWARSLAGSIALALGVGILAACGSSGASSGSSGSTMNILSFPGADIGNVPLSPLELLDGWNSQVMGLMWGNLIVHDSSGANAPGPLVTGMPDISADSTQFTFHLKHDIKWSDGQPLTSADVMFTFNLLANTNAGSTSAGNYSAVEGYQDVASGTATRLTGFQAPDPYTFVVKLSTPSVAFLDYLSNAYILPQHILKNAPIKNFDSNQFFRNPTVGIGPYLFKKMVPDQYVEMTADPTSYLQPKTKTIFLQELSPDATTAQLASGELSEGLTDPVSAKVLKNNKNIKLYTAQQQGPYAIMTNDGESFLKDPRIREAMSYALDRNSIVKNIENGYAIPWSSNFLQKPLAAVGPSYDYDVAKAKELLKEAGWNPNQTLTFIYDNTTADWTSLVTVIQQEFAAVGIKMNIETVSPTVRINDLTQDKGWDLTWLAGGNFVTDPWSVYLYSGCNNFFPKYGSNISHVCVPQFDSLMQKANSTADATARLDVYKQAAAIMNQDLYIVPILVPDYIYAVSTKITGFDPNAMAGANFTQTANWSLSP